MNQIDELKKNNDLIIMRCESVERTNEILRERIKMLKINIQAKEETIEIQRYINMTREDEIVKLKNKILNLERILNKLQSNHNIEKEN